MLTALPDLEDYAPSMKAIKLRLKEYDINVNYGEAFKKILIILLIPSKQIVFTIFKLFLYIDLGQYLSQTFWEPPVPFTHQTHGRRHQQYPDDRGV